MARAFAEMVERYRGLRGWTKTDFAVRVKPDKAEGTAISYVSKILRGVVSPPLDQMALWADLLRIDGAERDRFMLLALLAQADERVETLFLRMERKLAAYEAGETPDDQSA